MRKLVWTLTIAALIFFISQTVLANDKKATQKPRLFSEFGIGFSAGAVFMETATAREYKKYSALGVELILEIFADKKSHNHINFEIDFNTMLNQNVKGTERFEVKTNYKQADFLFSYDYRWSYFLIRLNTGLSMNITTVVTSIYDTGDMQVDPLSYEFSFPDKELEQEERETGIIYGPVASFGFGTDFVKILGGESQYFEILIFAKYHRREKRNDISCWFNMVFWPTALF